MNIRDHRALKDAARQSLDHAAYNPKKLILIHTGAILILSLLLTVADYLLEQQIGSTSGLDGMGTRSILATAQAVLRLVQTAALPFWQMGYVFLTLKLSRGETVGPQTLTQGFHWVGSVFRLKLVQGIIYFGIGIACSYLSSLLFFMTPWAAPLTEKLLPLLSDASMLENPAALQETMIAAMEDTTVPLLVIFGIVFLAVSAPIFYHYRMADYSLMDNPSQGALSALRSSRKLMHHNCIALFRLDLSFWWFYLLDGLVSAMCYGDLLLNLLGVQLPFSADFSYFLFFGLYLICQLVLYWWRKNEVAVIYAHAYTALQCPPAPKSQPDPKNQPWIY